MIFRNLKKSDYSQYLNLLSQLTTVKKSDIDKFNNFVNNLPENHIVQVYELNNKIVACGTIFIEQKVIHDMGKVGHIEDIVVDKESRGKKLGLKLIKHLENIGKTKGCYKIILDCDVKNIKFYEKCGFIEKGVEMAKYF
tara:strand:+ start:147 stop:563 length:417 start_codon:yes stop_codon:yes gene_type:complete